MRLSPYPIARSPWEVNDLFTRQRFVDPPGHRLHVFFAAVACFLAGWPTSTVEWAPLPVLLCFLIRMTTHHRVLRPLWLDPCGLLTLAWSLWLFASVAWSAARQTPAPASHWIDGLSVLRYAGFVLVLWPALDHRRTLIIALAAGIACGQITQLGQFLQQSIGVHWFPITRMPGRTSGWWDPVVAGSILCAALGLHLGGALFTSHRRIGLIGLIASVLTLISIIATGTRGAWIGAALLIFIALLIAARRMVSVAQAFRLRILALLVLALISAAVYFTPPLRDRLSRGVSEVAAALTSENYNSDTGLRIAMWKWGFAAWRTHPIAGVGSGGYRPWVQSQTPESAAILHAPHSIAHRIHAHAHSWYIHTLAITGLVGAIILFSLTFLAIRSGLRSTPPVPGGFSGYSAGPALALIGLCCAGLFDSITTNAQTSYLFWILITLCLPKRPTPRPIVGISPHWSSP